MATDLQDLLNGTAEAKRMNFASEDFAAGYGRSVIGRVKRRRAVSATAIGGGSLVAVGALTFGAASVPWNSFSPLTPGAATCEPASALSSPSPTGSAAERAFIITVLLPKGTLTTIVTQESEGQTESVVTSETLQDETATLKLVNGTLLQDDGEGNFTELQRTDGVFTITFPSGAERFLTVDPAEGNEPGTEPGHVIYEANGTDLVIDLAREPLAPEPSSSADADCVTPEPSSSPTPSPSSSASPTPSAGTLPEAVQGGSPFQCGFEFSGPAGSTGVITIAEPLWISAGSAEATVNSMYVDPDSNRFAFSGDDVPTVQYSSSSTWPGGNYGGEVGFTDPAELPDSFSYEADGEVIYDGVLSGAQFVLAMDDVVIATFASEDGADSGVTQFLNSAGDGNGTLFGLDLTSGFVACPGVDPDSLDGAQAVAVAGAKLVGRDTVDGPYYAWRYITTS